MYVQKWYRLGWCLVLTSHPRGLLVSCSQTAFSSFLLGWEEKGSGNLTLEFPCYKIPESGDC